MAADIPRSREFMRLERNLGIELLWLYILSVLRKKSLHAYAIRSEVKESFGLSIGEVTAYVVLYKLESRDFVRPKKMKNRKVYRITAKGKELFSLAEKYIKKREKMLFS
jgi:DNA-binding PadR family transcriptional regulator